MTRGQESKSHPAGGVSAVKQNPGIRGKQIAVPLMFLIGALVFGIACSKRGGSSTSASSQASAAQNTATTPVVASPIVAATASNAPAAKKVTKRHPVNATYANATYGVSFRYPRKYKFESGRSLKPEATEASIPMNFVQPGGTIVADVQLPKGSYPGTDFASGMFQASVNAGLSQDQCQQFANPDTDELTGESLVPSEVKIGGRSFQEMDHFPGPGQPADAKYYHAFENGMCYEFAMGLDRLETADGMKPIDPVRVFAKLDKILSTVRLESVTEQPQVTAGESVASQPSQQEVNNQ